MGEQYLKLGKLLGLGWGWNSLEASRFSLPLKTDPRGNSNQQCLRHNSKVDVDFLYNHADILKH